MFDLDRGFAHWTEEEGPVRLFGPGRPRNPESSGGIENTFALAKDWLAEYKSERFFLFVHTYEVHTPYNRRDFTGRLDPGKIGRTFRMEYPPRIKTGDMVLSDSEIEYVSALYDGGVVTADRHIGAFLSFLDAQGLKNRTLVVVTSDHGEELGEHYRSGIGDHGHSLLDNLLRIPLILYHPQREFAVSEVVAQVRLLDGLPTMAELMGVSADRPADGISLVPILDGVEREDRIALAATGKRGPPRVCIRSGRYKYIEATGRTDVLDSDLFMKDPPLSPAPPARQLYDLRRDPGETNNLAESETELADAMADAIEDAYAGYADATRLTTPEVLDRKLIERLRSLGYVGN